MDHLRRERNLLRKTSQQDGSMSEPLRRVNRLHRLHLRAGFAPDQIYIDRLLSQKLANKFILNLCNLLMVAIIQNSSWLQYSSFSVFTKRKNLSAGCNNCSWNWLRLWNWLWLLNMLWHRNWRPGKHLKTSWRRRRDWNCD